MSGNALATIVGAAVVAFFAWRIMRDLKKAGADAQRADQLELDLKTTKEVADVKQKADAKSLARPDAGVTDERLRKHNF